MPNPTYRPLDLVRYTATGHLIQVGVICRISERQEGSPGFAGNEDTVWIDVPRVGMDPPRLEEGWSVRRYWCATSYFEPYSLLPPGAEEALTNFIDMLRQT